MFWFSFLFLQHIWNVINRLYTVNYTELQILTFFAAVWKRKMVSYILWCPSLGTIFCHILWPIFLECKTQTDIEVIILMKKSLKISEKCPKTFFGDFQLHSETFSGRRVLLRVTEIEWNSYDWPLLTTIERWIDAKKAISSQ